MATSVQHVLAVATFLLFVIAPLPLGLCTIALRRIETERTGSAENLLILLAVWSVLQAVIAHALGLLHVLGLPAMVAAELSLFAGGLVCAVRVFGIDPVLHAGTRLRPSRGLHAPESVTLLALALMGSILLWWTMAMPVVDWDSWAFHMPPMVISLQTGTFTRIEQYASGLQSSYPYGWEAVCTLFLVPFGEDLLVTFPNLVAWAALGLATHRLARLGGADRANAFACATLLLSIHYVADVVDTMHTDVPFAAWFMASAAFGAMFATRGSRVSLALCAATLGLSCATRATGPVYAGFLLAWLLWTRRFWRADIPPTVARARALRWFEATAIAAGVALAVFWYVKNVIELGGPFGTVVPLPGATNARTAWRSLARSTLAVKADPLAGSSWIIFAERAFGELDVPFVSIVLLAALWPLALLLRRDARHRMDTSLALLVFGTGALFWFTPTGAVSGIQVRLGLPFLASLASIAAVGATRARLPAMLPSAFALVSVTRTLVQSRVVFPFLAAAVAWGIARNLGPVRASRRAIAVVSMSLLLLFTATTFLARERRERERREIYGAFYVHLEERADSAEPLAYLLGERSYLLYGRSLARRVVFAPYRVGGDVSRWVANLRQRGISLVAVGPFSGEDLDAQAALEQLVAPAGPLVAVSGHGRPGEVTIYRLGAVQP